MEKTNYYIILGVERDEDAGEIRQAFRRLAKACHPDSAGPGKIEEFDRIAKAYEVLSDPEKRARYNRDLDQAEGRRTSRDSRQGFSAGRNGRPAFSEAFDVLRDRVNRGAFDPKRRPKTKRAQVFEHKPEMLEILLSPDEAAQGGVLAFTIPVRRLCPKCGGMGVEWPLHCSTCQGLGEIHSEEAVELNIPAGAKSGLTLNLSMSRSDPRRQDIRIVLKVA